MIKAALMLALMALSSCQTSEDRAWAHYSRGIDHVLYRQ